MQQIVRSTGSRGRLIPSLIIMLTLIAGLVGPLGAQQVAAQDIQTRVIFLHGATELGKVEIALNGDEVADEFEYGQQTDWINVEPGTVQVTITRDRAGINYSVFNVVYPVPAGNDYFVVITDALVLGGVFDKSPIPGNGARVQVTHASVDTPKVDIVADGDKINFATSLGFGRTSDVAEVPAGSYDSEIRLADTDEVLITATGGAVEAGKVYQYILIGKPGDEDKPLQIVALSTDANQ